MRQLTLSEMTSYCDSVKDRLQAAEAHLQRLLDRITVQLGLPSESLLESEEFETFSLLAGTLGELGGMNDAVRQTIPQEVLTRP